MRLQLVSEEPVFVAGHGWLKSGEVLQSSGDVHASHGQPATAAPATELEVAASPAEAPASPPPQEAPGA